MLCCALGLAGSSLRADEAPIDQWFDLGIYNAATASASVASATIELVSTNGPHTALVGYFDPIEFKPGSSVTASCRILVPDGPTNATQQYRIGLYGVVKGTDPATKKQQDLRGFVLAGGNTRNVWELAFAEHDRKEGGLIYSAGMTEIARVQAEKTGGRGAEARVVLTLSRQADGSIVANGFWGDMPFSFRCMPRAGEYTHLRAIAFMRGRTTGDQKMTVSNVRVRSD